MHSNLEAAWAWEVYWHQGLKTVLVLRNVTYWNNVSCELLLSSYIHLFDNNWRANEALSGVLQSRAGAVYVYGDTCSMKVAHATNMCCGKS